MSLFAVTLPINGAMTLALLFEVSLMWQLALERKYL
jgi:hypothetical protein